MADGYGNIVTGWRVHVAAWVTGSTDTTDTIHVEARWQAVNSYYYIGWVAATVWINGQQVGHTDNSGVHNTGTNGEVTVCSGDLTVSKTDGARNITCSASIYFNAYGSTGTSNASCGVSVGGINYKNPRPPKNVAWKRVDDSNVDSTWQGDWDAGYPQPWKQVVVDKSEGLNGGDQSGWSMATALGWSAVNYRYTGLKTNARYQFRCLARNQVGDSGHVTSGYIYTTPAAPKSFQATKGAKQVALYADVTNTYPWRLQVQRKSNLAPEWVTVIDKAQPANGKLNALDDAPAGIVTYRARVIRPVYGDDDSKGVLYGAWLESNQVTTITPPLAPTILNPTSGAAYDVAKTLTVSWKPNHPDGSMQSAAQIEYSIGSGTATVVDITDSSTTTTISPSSRTGTWKLRVRTKGLDEKWGAWGDYVSFTVAVAPNIVITSPLNGIDIMPFDIAWSVADATGVSQQRVTITRDGSTVYDSRPTADTRSVTIRAADFLPANGSTFLVTVTVRGGSTLTSTASRSVKVSYTPPAKPVIDTTVDANTLSATHTVHYGTPSAGEPPTDHILLRRIIDDSPLQLSDRLTDGQQAIDRLPPLRYDYVLEAVAVAASGAVSTTRVTQRVETDHCCLNFGTDAAQALPIGGAFKVSEKPSLSTKEYHFASGDSLGLPSSYLMRDLDDTVSVSSRYDWIDGSLYRLIRRLSRVHAYAWFRNMDGSRMRCRVVMSQQLSADGLTVDFTASLDEITWKEPVT